MFDTGAAIFISTRRLHAWKGKQKFMIASSDLARANTYHLSADTQDAHVSGLHAQGGQDAHVSGLHVQGTQDAHVSGLHAPDGHGPSLRAADAHVPNLRARDADGFLCGMPPDAISKARMRLERPVVRRALHKALKMKDRALALLGWSLCTPSRASRDTRAAQEAARVATAPLADLARALGKPNRPAGDITDILVCLDALPAETQLPGSAGSKQQASATCAVRQIPDATLRTLAQGLSENQADPRAWGPRPAQLRLAQSSWTDESRVVRLGKLDALQTAVHKEVLARLEGRMETLRDQLDQQMYAAYKLVAKAGARKSQVVPVGAGVDETFARALRQAVSRQPAVGHAAGAPTPAQRACDQIYTALAAAQRRVIYDADQSGVRFLPGVDYDEMLSKLYAQVQRSTGWLARDGQQALVAASAI
jgi:hypothetical protein